MKCDLSKSDFISIVRAGKSRALAAGALCPARLSPAGGPSSGEGGGASVLHTFVDGDQSGVAKAAAMCSVSANPRHVHGWH